jgi:hypothetical protein
LAILNNPLFLVAASAAISAVITAAIETAITNRQKDALERRLEEIRHKHALEVEQLKYENASQLEREASHLRLAREHDRGAAEQRLIKLPKAIAAAYKLRYLYLDVLNALSSEQGVTYAQSRNYVESLSALSNDLLQIDDPEVRGEARKLVALCQIGPSDLIRFVPRSGHSEFVGDEETNRLRETLLGKMRLRYEEIKEAQTRMLGLLEKSDQRPTQE